MCGLDAIRAAPCHRQTAPPLGCGPYRAGGDTSCHGLPRSEKFIAELLERREVDESAFTECDSFYFGQ